ncbi:MAG: efflux RND transporter periplasmic adaptor subunit [Bryobacteraceae bacterium]|nr:efflux RND transporter periplasmic adaptor subunit [Bryobacteraceae bacterium]
MSAAHSPVPVQDPKLSPSPVTTPARPPETKSRRWIIWLILAILVVGAIAVWQADRTKTPAPPTSTVAFRTATATSGSVERVVRVAGQTSAVQFSSITAPMMRGPDSNREMILLHVSPAGSWVKKGTLIAKIDGQSMQDHVDDLADTIESAQSDVRKRGAEQSIELENLQQSLRIAKSDADKSRLEYNGSETQTDIQRQLLKLTLDESDAKLKQLQADVSQKKISHAAELKVLELTLIRHTRHRNRHVHDLDAFSVNASMDGLVVMQPIWRGSEMGQVQIGDRLSAGQPFMKIVNTKIMQVEGSVNQSDSGDFRIGQRARIRLDAFGNLGFDGKVHSIGALASGGWRNSYFVRNVPIRVDIEGNDPRLIPDLTAGVDVILESSGKQTTVPISALVSENGKDVLYVKSGETFERREIATGVRGDTQVAIASGLRPGEVVRLN